MHYNKDSVIRLMLLVVALLNHSLTTLGYSPLPFDDQTITDAVSIVFTVAAGLLVFWKNNDFTKEAAAGTSKTRNLKKLKKVEKKHGKN